MRVGIDASCWSVQRGYGRYTRGMLGALMDVDSPHEFVLIVDRQTYQGCEMPAHATYRIAETGVSPSQAAAASGSRSVRDVWAMAQTAAREPFDAFFFPSIYSYFPLLRRSKMLLCIHDIIAELYPDKVFPNPLGRFLWNSKHWLGRTQADVIVTVSEFARKRLCEHYKYKPDDVHVVGEAPDPIFRPITDATLIDDAFARYHLPRDQRYVACLGGLNPHKNIGMLLDVLADLRRDPRCADLHLILIGPAESDLFTPGVADVRQKIDTLGLREAVHLTGYIDDEDVARLLNGVEALVLPSLEEGYGLGAVEAAACGTPVIATTYSPLPALLAGGGWFIDPFDPAELALALRDLLDDAAERGLRGAVALRQAQKLSWQQSAREFLTLLGRVSPHARA